MHSADPICRMISGISISLVIILLISTGVYAGIATICGDVTGDNQVDIDDPVFIIAYIFAGGPSPPGLSGDVDMSGNTDIDDVTYLIAYIFASGPPPCDTEGPSGEMIDHSDCKYHWKLPADSIPFEEDCVIYNYDGTGILTIEHINAGFNCCPVILADITIDGFEIVIDELDSLWEGYGCPCLCVFDVDYVISGLDPGIYIISIIEPYKCSGEASLQFAADLRSPVTDMFCITRGCYPWTEM